MQHKKCLLKAKDWLEEVNKTRQSIIHSPEQYLIDPVKKEFLEVIIMKVFKELEEELQKIGSLLRIDS